MEQAVIIHIPLVDNAFGGKQELKLIEELIEKLENIIVSSNIGEYDGEEFGGAKCIIYTYSTNADNLFNIMLPILKSAPVIKNGFVIKRYGDAGDEHAKEIRINF